MNDLLLFWSNVLLVLLEVIVLVFFASVFFKKNLSRRKFGASVILLVISNITALALLDSHFWSKAFAVIIVDAIWLKISYDDTIMQSIGIAIGFYSFVSVWDVLVLLAVSFLSKNKSIEHGYGLKNVTAILENINALYVFDYNSQKHLFSFSAQFPISR